jgi:hypothetical protein
VAGYIDAVRAMLADLTGADDTATPYLPDNLPASARPAVSDGVYLLIDYQGPSYAQLYLDRLRRFIGRNGVDDAMLIEIAELLALRMAYQDAIRLAQLKFAEWQSGRPPVDQIVKFRLDELISVLPELVAEPVLDTLDWVGWTRLPVTMRFSARTGWGVRRLRIEAYLRRWRLLSVRYPKERALVERWLHMIGRSLDKQPAATAAVVRTAEMLQGYGESYRQRLAAWHQIIDGLVKPTFDGALTLLDLSGAIAQAREASRQDPSGVSLKRLIADTRADALADSQHRHGRA